MNHRKLPFNLLNYLATAGVARRLTQCARGHVIFGQGDTADAVFYIQKGGVKLTALSEHGREAVIAILGMDEFLGEECLAGQPVRLATATAMAPSSILRIRRKEMFRVLHAEHAFSSFFVRHVLTRSIRIQGDLVDQLFNSSEKRLARALLLLAHYGKPGKPETLLPSINQETLAAMIGTTRTRVSTFMNKFRKLGFIHYNGGLQVHSSLLNVVLHD
jgi:CRP/FNR family transcriptional regulator, cyclic AMP receptor protein